MSELDQSEPRTLSIGPRSAGGLLTGPRCPETPAWGVLPRGNRHRSRRSLDAGEELGLMSVDVLFLRDPVHPEALVRGGDVSMGSWGSVI